MNIGRCTVVRIHVIYVLLLSVGLLAGTCGCGGRRGSYRTSNLIAPASRPSSGVYSKKHRERRGVQRLERTGWLHVVGQDRKVVGYLEEITHPRYKEKKIQIVYDKFLEKVGFVTPHGVVYKYKKDGSSKRMGLVPAKGVQGYLLGIHGDVDFVNPLKREAKEDLVLPQHAIDEMKPKPE